VIISSKIRRMSCFVQIALGRDQDAGRAGHGLDDHRGDGRGVVQGHEVLQHVGEVGAVLGLAPGEGVRRQPMGVRKMVDAGQERAEVHAVLHHAAHGDPAEADAVIAALAADQARARSLAARPLVGQGDLQGRVDGFGTRVGEEDAVQALGRQLRHAPRELEGKRMAEVEGRGVVELAGLPANGLDDARAAVPGVDAPEPRRAVQDLSAVVGVVVHALRTRDDARVGLEPAVRRERHPEGVEIGRGVAGVGHGALLSGGRSVITVLGAGVNGAEKGSDVGGDHGAVTRYR
jgi:hypothetical protein